MRKVTLTRWETGDQGTFGKLSADDVELGIYTGELPWKDNKRTVSCIPFGTYQTKWVEQPRHGLCYELQNVPDRSDILIHSGNYCGDKSKELKSDTEGCILLGKDLDVISGQKAVVASKKAVNRFKELMKQEPFELEIKHVGGKDENRETSRN